jgi:hypothetical protein
MVVSIANQSRYFHHLLLFLAQLVHHSQPICSVDTSHVAGQTTAQVQQSTKNMFVSIDVQKSMQVLIKIYTIVEKNTHNCCQEKNLHNCQQKLLKKSTQKVSTKICIKECR